MDASVRVELRDVENGLRRMQLAGIDLRPVFRSVRKALRADQREHAKEQRGPDAPWRPLAASTIEHRKARTGKQGRKRRKPIRAKVKALGRLPGNFVVTFTPKAIKATSRVKWSGAHNDPAGAVVGHGARLPGRTFLWASSKLLTIVRDKAVEHMLTAWKRGP